MKTKQIVIGPRYKRYRLGEFLIEPVDSSGHLQRGYGVFSVRGEVRRALQVALGQITGGSTHYGLKLQAYSRSNPRDFGAFSVSITEGRIHFGCTRFSKADSKKLAKWAGVEI